LRGAHQPLDRVGSWTPNIAAIPYSYVEGYYGLAIAATNAPSMLIGIDHADMTGGTDRLGRETTRLRKERFNHTMPSKKRSIVERVHLEGRSHSRALTAQRWAPATGADIRLSLLLLGPTSV